MAKPLWNKLGPGSVDATALADDRTVDTVSEHRNISDSRAILVRHAVTSAKVSDGAIVAAAMAADTEDSHQS